LDPIGQDIDHLTTDCAYDKSPVHDAILPHSPDVDIVIPPREDAVFGNAASEWHNRNLQEIKIEGRMQRQRKQNYGQRNYSELAVQRYQRVLSDTMHVRDLTCQKQEAMIGCGVLNNMTYLGM